MKKLSLLFLVVSVLAALMQSCSDSKTYAEMLEDEKNAIKAFIAKHDINVISLEEFEKDTVTDVSKNEYVFLPNGVYLQIVNRGTADTLKYRDELLLRMTEYNIMCEIDDTAYPDTISNVDVATVVDSFFYDPTSTSTTMTEGWFPYVYSQFYGTLNVPYGIVYSLRYVRDMARFNVIVPSKMGHGYAGQEVYPFFYEIRKVQKAF